MDGEFTWGRYREMLCVYAPLGLTLDVSRTGRDAAFSGWMSEPMRLAFEAMADLERGAIANPDEGRQVGHYWLRAPELAPGEEIPREIRAMQASIHSFAREVNQGTLHPVGARRFTQLLVIGIGGSALGPQWDDEIPEAIGASDEVETMLHVLEHLLANPGRGVAWDPSDRGVLERRYIPVQGESQ